jgi:hypothetical protein
MTVSYKNTVILKGRRTRSTRLWHLDLNHHDGHEKFQAPSGLHGPPSHVAALKQLIEVLTSSSICKDEDPAPNPQQSLRVEPSQAHVIAFKEVEHAPLRADTPLCKVHFAPVPSMTAKPTYETTTGTKGAQRRKQQRAQPPKPISQAKTAHPNKNKYCVPLPVPTHRYETRSTH